MSAFNFLLIFAFCFGLAHGQRGSAVAQDITPIPMEFLNPRLTEFRRIDSNNDNSLTFSEFLLSDRPFIESQSRYFHELDGNGDGRVAREEFENYFKKRDDESHRQRIQTDSFFKQLALPSFETGSLSPSLFGFRQTQIFSNKNKSSGPQGQQTPPPPTEQQTPAST